MNVKWELSGLEATVRELMSWDDLLARMNDPMWPLVRLVELAEWQAQQKARRRRLEARERTRRRKHGRR